MLFDNVPMLYKQVNLIVDGDLVRFLRPVSLHFEFRFQFLQDAHGVNGEQVGVEALYAVTWQDLQWWEDCVFVGV